MANDSLLQGATPHPNPAGNVSGTDETGIDRDAPPGMNPAHEPSDTEQSDDWVDPTAGEDVPPADEPTPLSDDRR